MTKHATGGAFTTRGCHFLRVTITPGKRAAVAVPWATTREAALERARVVQALVDRLRAAGHADLVPKVVEAAAAEDPARLEAIGRAIAALLAGELVKATPKPDASAPVTFQKFAERWTSGELARLFPDHVRAKRSAGDDEGRLTKHVYPVIGARPLASLTLDDALEVLRRLPPELSRASRRHVAQVLSRVFALAVYPCRILEASPLPRGFLPRLGRKKARSALYPDEEARLLACEAIPLAHRVLYGFLAREGMRAGEALSLTYADLDLDRGVVRLDENKTDDARAWALDDGTARALAAWAELGAPHAPDARVFGVADPGHLADDFRAHLRAAGVERAELFERSDARRPIRAHDLRATFITAALASGRTEAEVTAKTGHRSSSEVNNYRRLAATFTKVGAGWLEPMDRLLGPALAAAKTAADAAASPGNPPKKPTATPQKCTGRDSNPHASRRRNLKNAPRGTLADSRVIPRPVEDGGGPSGAPLPRVAAACEGAAEVGHEGAEGAPVASSGEASDDGAIGDRAPSPGELEPGPSAAPRDGAEEPRDVVHALALALERASRAGRWDVVAQLGRELEARRLEAAGNVVPIGAKRGDRR